MKRAFLFALFLAPAVGMGQSGNYVLKGKVGNYNAPAKIFLTYKAGSQVTTDSTFIKNGAFEFKGAVKEPFSASLVLDRTGKGFQNLDFKSEQDILGIYLEKGTITVSGTDSISRANISGSALNADGDKLRKLLKPVEAKIAALNHDWIMASDEKKGSQEFSLALQNRYEAIQTEQKSIFKNFILSNPSSFVSLDVLKSIAGQNPDYAELQPLYAALSPKLKETGYGKALGKSLEADRKTAVGATALDFTQNDVNGKPVKLSDFKGQYVLLDFWASWCGPCRQENPNLVNAYHKFKDKNFTVLGVSLDRANGKDAWLKAISDDKLPWTQVSDLKFWNNDAAVLYGVRSIPQNFLLDPQGKIIAKNLRGEDLERMLEELIK